MGKQGSRVTEEDEENVIHQLEWQLRIWPGFWIVFKSEYHS